MQLQAPQIPFLIEPIVPLGGVVFMYGKSGIGKSPMSWMIADAVSAGTSIFGMTVSAPMPVLYVDVDTRWWTIQDRWRKANYAPKFDIAVGEGFDCLSPLWDHSPVRKALIERHRDCGYKLVCISTLAKIHSFGFSDANAPAEVYRRWQEVFGEQCALLFIHHDKKSSAGEELDADTAYHVRRESFSGSQQWLDHATTALHLTRRGGGYKFLFDQVKDQGSKKIEPLKLILNENNGVGIVEDVEDAQTQKENWLK